MSGAKQVVAAVVNADASGPLQQQSKKRKKRSSGRNGGSAAQQTFVGGWSKVNLDDVQVEGFEDGCAFELEEMTGACVACCGWS